MFKIQPHQQFVSDDQGTAIQHLQRWLTDESENGQWVPLQLDVRGGPGRLSVGGATATSMIVFTRADSPKRTRKARK